MPAHIHKESDDDGIQDIDEEGDKQHGDNSEGEEGEIPGWCIVVHLFCIAITHWWSQWASLAFLFQPKLVKNVE